MSVGGGFQPPAPPQTPAQPLGQSQPPQSNAQFGYQPDMSMGFARNFQQPSFFNPFFGAYGAPYQYGMGGFGGGFGGGFNPMMGGIGGFGGYGGFGGMGGGENWLQPKITTPPSSQPILPGNSRYLSADVVPYPMMGGFGGGFNSMRSGIGSLGGFQNQFGNAYAPQMQPQPSWERNPDWLAGITPLSAAGQEPQAATGVAGPQRTFSGPNALIDGMKAMEQDRIAREGQRGKYGWHNGLWSA